MADLARGRVAEVRAGVVKVVRGLLSRAMTTPDSMLSRADLAAAALAAPDRAALVDLVDQVDREPTLTRC